MPIINFSVADVLRGKLLDAGWYSFQVAKLEQKPAKDKGSINYEWSLSLIDQNNDLNGKEVINRNNSKAISMMIPFAMACKGIKSTEVKAEAFSLDLDELVGCKVDAKVIVETYEGQLKNDFESFVPYKTAAGQGVTF